MCISHITFDAAGAIKKRGGEEQEEGIDHKFVKKNNNVLKMLQKLDSYQTMVLSDVFKFARVLEARTRNINISDEDTVRNNLCVPSPDVTENPAIETYPDMSDNFLQDVLDERSLCRDQEDKVARFLQATENCYSNIYPLNWWALNNTIFLFIAKVASNILAVQASLVDRESLLYVTGNLLSEKRLRLSAMSNYVLLAAFMRLCHLLDR